MPQEYQIAGRPIKRVGLHYTDFGPQNRDGSVQSMLCATIFRRSAKAGLGRIIT
jgi:hypothetical protein